MTQKSQPWDNNGIGDAIYSPYSAQEWADVWSNLVGYGVQRANYGVVRGSNPASTIVDALAVTVTSPISNQVTLKPGAAIVDGTQYTNDADLNFTIAANASGNSRIDTLILRKDFTLQTIRAAILQGTPAASPVPPSLTQSALFWEIPIADITVANGFATLNDSTIRMRAESANTPDGVYMDGILNNSGATLEDGDAVVWSSVARSVATTTVRNHFSPAGIWRGRTLNGDYGRLQVAGLCIARTGGVNQVQAIGDECTTGQTAKLLEGKTTGSGVNYIAKGNPNSFGVAMSLPDANSGKFLLALNIQRKSPGFWYASSTALNTINSTTLTAMTGFSIQTLTSQFTNGGLLCMLFCRVNRSTIPRFQFRVSGSIFPTTYDGSPVGVGALGIVDNMVSWAYFSQFNLRTVNAPLIEVLWANNAGGAVSIQIGEISMVVMETGNEVP